MVKIIKKNLKVYVSFLKLSLFNNITSCPACNSRISKNNVIRLYGMDESTNNINNSNNDEDNLDTTNRSENDDSISNETNDNVRASLDQVNID